jgi:hypothetical protein
MLTGSGAECQLRALIEILVPFTSPLPAIVGPGQFPNGHHRGTDLDEAVQAEAGQGDRAGGESRPGMCALTNRLRHKPMAGCMVPGRPSLLGGHDGQNRRNQHCRRYLSVDRRMQ